MKKALPLASLFVIIGLCVAIAIQTRTIASLEKQLAALSRDAAERENRLKKDGEELEHVRHQNQMYKQESETLRSRLAGGGGASAPEAAGDGAAPAAAAPEKEGGGFAKALAKMFTDPDMKKAMRQQQAMGMRMVYSDLAKELGLSADDTQKLMDLLADRQMEISGKSMALMNGGGDASKIDTAGKEINSVRETYDAKLKEMLGGDGFTRLQQYERTAGDRVMMQQYQQQFSATGEPLQDGQRESLLQIMYDERAKTPANPFDPSNKDVAGQMKALQSDQALHDFIASQEDFNRRVLDRARGVLSSGQFEQFEKIQKQMMDMQQVGIKMGRTMFKGQ